MAGSTLPTLAPAVPFDAVALNYDEAFTNSLVGRAQRQAVWRVLDRTFRPGQRVLELGCGTGVDAVHLAERGVEVVATDASSRMIAVAERRVAATRLCPRPQFRVLAAEDLSLLDEGVFDGAFSNFAALNCVADLAGVAQCLAVMLRPGARVVLCMAGRFVGWEVLWYVAHGNLRKAFRRFHKRGTLARLGEGVTVNVHYPSVRRLARLLAPEFRMVEWSGVGVLVPPSYLEALARRFPRTFETLARVDPWLGRRPGLRALADHALVVFERG